LFKSDGIFKDLHLAKMTGHRTKEVNSGIRRFLKLARSPASLIKLVIELPSQVSRPRTGIGRVGVETGKSKAHRFECSYLMDAALKPELDAVAVYFVERGR